MSADADITINKRVAINKFKKHINQISYEHQEVLVLNETHLIQYFSYALSAIGNLAFIVSMITQVIKEMPVLRKFRRM